MDISKLLAPEEVLLMSSAAAVLRRADEKLKSSLAPVKSLAEVLARREYDREKRHSASAVVTQVLQQVQAFEASLDGEHEVGIHLVNFGQAVTIRITSVGFIEPAIIVFSGVNNDGQEVRLVQHIHQLSFLLWKAPRLHPEQPRTPIGFISANE
jgi:hypothetical protein